MNHGVVSAGDEHGAKRTPHDLAILGGPPRFRQPLVVGTPNVGDRRRFARRMGDALDSRRLSNGGPLVVEFEQAIAAATDVRYCVATCNATTGLQVAMRALGLTGEVIVPSLTFAATAHAVAWIGLTPVFCDVDPETGCIDPDSAQRLIGPATSAIIGVHLWGHPCACDELAAVCERHRLALLFDAAHAFGCTYRGRPIGGMGDAEVFSFHATKFVNSFEGGAIATNDASLAATARAIHNFGITGEDTVSMVGTNGKMSEACAAMGLTSLEQMPRVVARNRDNYLGYRDGLGGLPGVRVLAFDQAERHNYQYVAVLVEPDACGLHRDRLLEVLRAENVHPRRYFFPGCHQMPPYLRTSTPVRLPTTESLADRVLVLPTGLGVTPDDVAEICRIVRLAVAGADELTRR